jgi:hypothetical protein
MRIEYSAGMPTKNTATVIIPASLARRVEVESRRRSLSRERVVSQALEAYFEAKDEGQFLREFRRSARQKGIRSQRAITKVIENVRRTER